MDAVAEFSRNVDGKFYIKFSDATYVRSDIIIVDRKDSSVHAVLEGSSYHVGYLPADLAKTIVDKSDVILSAPHYSKGALTLMATVSVN